uniref:voltage-dependent calcium channel beta subunit-associated regulatory protein n=1 Tax=Myxine glutinosa TaxID=7769 RepID=UPI00358DF99B
MIVGTQNGTAVPPAVTSPPEGQLPLLVLASVFVGGGLLLISGLLLICRRCCEGHRYERADDDADKTTTTYVEEGQQPREIAIQVTSPDEVEEEDDEEEDDESGSEEAVAAGRKPCAAEAQRFLAAAGPIRRVSFNEAALFEHECRAEEKTRRFTLTEGDFHHLKNARLMPLGLSSPLSLHMLTEAGVSPQALSQRPSLSLVQPGPGFDHAAVLAALAPRPPVPLPGDTWGVPGREQDAERGLSPVHPTQSLSTRSSILTRLWGRLRRRTSEGTAHGSFSLRPWPRWTAQRAASLDTRGTPWGRGSACIAEEQNYEIHAPENETIPPPSPRPRPDGADKRETSSTEDAEAVASPEDDVEEPGASIQAASGPRDLWSLRASLELQDSSDVSGEGSALEEEIIASADCGLEVSEAQSPVQCPHESHPQHSAPDPPAEQDPRRLIQMDSGYVSIEGVGAEKRHRFGRTKTIFGSRDGWGEGEEQEREARRVESEIVVVVIEEPEIEGEAETATIVHPSILSVSPRVSSRDYCVDEKTDALFREFLRHDPRFDAATVASGGIGAPATILGMSHKSKHHRVPRPPHLHHTRRQQWQRGGKQMSDPGVPVGGGVRRAPLRRGHSVGHASEGRYYVTLPRIVSAGDEEGGESAGPSGVGVESGGVDSATGSGPVSVGDGSPPVTPVHSVPPPTLSLAAEKLATHLTYTLETVPAALTEATPKTVSMATSNDPQAV